MMKRLWLVAVATCVSAAPALAQEQRAEVSVLFGWALSDGVDGDPVATADGNIFNRVDPKDSFKWGLGATNYSSVEYMRRNGQTATIGGETRLSSTWGAGVKFYAGPNVGARVGIQWTPTYIKSDAVGWWCIRSGGATSWAMPSIRSNSTSAPASRSGSSERI